MDSEFYPAKPGGSKATVAQHLVLQSQKLSRYIYQTQINGGPPKKTLTEDRTPLLPVRGVDPVTVRECTRCRAASEVIDRHLYTKMQKSVAIRHSS